MTTDLERALFDDMDTIAEIAEAGMRDPSDREDKLRRIHQIATEWEDP